MILAREVSKAGGKLIPLIHPPEHLSKDYPTIMNPSIFIENDTIKCVVRNTNYILWHNELNQYFNSPWGPLAYLNPEDDLKLKTRNWVYDLDLSLGIVDIQLIDTVALDSDPLWSFVGLEDARLVKWEDSWYLTGVRRDTSQNGQGRIELSEILNNVEFSRTRIEVEEESYCEKNWMPIIDLPFHFIRWPNPLEVVKVSGNSCVTLFKKPEDLALEGFRGGSQVIRAGDYRIAVIHEVFIHFNELNQRDGKYTHRFLIWDLDWNLKWTSEDFSFLDTPIEFACGLAILRESLVISLGASDNCAFLLQFPISWLENQSNLILR